MGIKKKILIGVIVAAGVTLGTYVTLTVVRNRSRKPVNVYKMSEVAQTDYWADSQDNYGTVSSDQVQNVFLTNTQTVKQVFVQKGQHVKVGDPLLAYDTTLSQINIERAENDVNQQKRTLDLAKKELVKMQKTRPIDAGGKTITPSVVSDEKENPGAAIDQTDDSDTDDSGEDVHFPVNPSDNPDDNQGTDGENGIDRPEFPQDTDHGEEPHAENDGDGTNPSESSAKETIGDQLDTNYQGKKIGKPHDYDAPALLDGVGTVDRPAIWLWSEKSDLTDETLKEMFNETMTARKNDKENQDSSESGDADEAGEEGVSSASEASFKDSDYDCYLVLCQYMENNPAHKKIAEHGLHLALRDGTLDVSLFNPDLLKVRNKADEMEEASESGVSSIPETDSETTEGENGTDISESDYAQEDDEDGQNAENFEDEAGTATDEDAENADGDETDVAAEEDSSEDGTAQSGSEKNAATKQSDENDDSEDYASMTRAELAKAINDQKNKIRDQAIAEQLAEVKLRQMQHELSDGIVSSRIDGVVKTVRDPDKAYEANKACVSVSNGGMSVTCTVSELSLSKVKQGMPVTVTSQESDNTADGKVTSVSTTPVGSGDSYGSSNNPNVSYYTCTVQIPGSADFKEHEFVSVSFENGNTSQHGLFLEGMFIRSDENGSYVYKRGKDDKLEKCYIKTGRDIGGGTMEILRGVTIRDRIAFPYGTGVMDGARTKNASTNDLYNVGGVG